MEDSGTNRPVGGQFYDETYASVSKLAEGTVEVGAALAGCVLGLEKMHEKVNQLVAGVNALTERLDALEGRFEGHVDDRDSFHRTDFLAEGEKLSESDDPR